MNPVIIKNITLTRPTQKATKLGENDLAVLLKNPKFKDMYGDLTVKVEFEQKREASLSDKPRDGGRRNSVYTVAKALEGHSKVNSADRVKRYWINAMNVKTLLAEGFKVGADYGEMKNCVAYLLTEEYSTAEFRDDRIVSSPKRKGKGGNFCLDANGAFIFHDTTLVTNEMEDFDQFEYADFVKFEDKAKIPFVDELEVAGVPDESKTDGFFDDDFETWLTEEYANRNEKVLTSVK